MERHTIINALIKRYNYKNYLEIGLNNPYDNYLKIQCENKECVVPYFNMYELAYRNVEEYNDLTKKINEVLTYRMTSDEFFEQNTKTYDIIFIDGLHTKEQVSRDIINALKCLNKGGKIVVHDCLPPTEQSQSAERVNGEWCGDVWKAIPELIHQGLVINTVNCDYGCAVIDYCEDINNIKVPSNFNQGWEDFCSYKNHLMHIISPEVFLLLLLIDK